MMRFGSKLCRHEVGSSSSSLLWGSFNAVLTSFVGRMVQQPIQWPIKIVLCTMIGYCGVVLLTQQSNSWNSTQRERHVLEDNQGGTTDSRNGGGDDDDGYDTNMIVGLFTDTNNIHESIVLKDVPAVPVPATKNTCTILAATFSSIYQILFDKNFLNPVDAVHLGAVNREYRARYLERQDFILRPLLMWLEESAITRNHPALLSRDLRNDLQYNGWDTRSKVERMVRFVAHIVGRLQIQVGLYRVKGRPLESPFLQRRHGYFSAFKNPNVHQRYTYTRIGWKTYIVVREFGQFFASNEHLRDTFGVSCVMLIFVQTELTAPGRIQGARSVRHHIHRAIQGAGNKEIVDNFCTAYPRWYIRLDDTHSGGVALLFDNFHLSKAVNQIVDQRTISLLGPALSSKLLLYGPLLDHLANAGEHFVASIIPTHIPVLRKLWNPLLGAAPQS